MNIKKLSRFRTDVYSEGSRPTLATLRKRIKEGKVAGGYQDGCGRYWVDMDRFNCGKDLSNLIQKIEMEDPLILKALK